MFIYLFLSFITGSFIGSFLNVLADRIPRNESFLKGRSYCESCKKKLSVLDLIPVISYLYLKGKCRYCKTPFSPFYLISELATGLMYAILIYVVVQIEGQPLSYLIYVLIIFSGLMAVLLADVKHGIIPDKIVFALIFLSLIFTFLYQPDLLFPAVLTGLGLFTTFLLLAILTRGAGMGGGDIKLVFLIGLFLGFPGGIVAVYIAFLTGALAGIILIICRKKKSIKESIPFGPFLVLGTFLTFLFHDFLIPKVLSFLNF